MEPLDTRELRQVMAEEMEKRRLSAAPGDYGYMPGSRESQMYGVVGAAHLHAQLGLDFGSQADRAAWIERINSFQRDDGTFECVSGPEHGACAAITALNLLGGRPGRPVRGLAPRSAPALEAWLNGLNWGGTHKDLCGGVAPVLASGFCGGDWVAAMRRNVEAHLAPERPLETWCGGGDPPSRVISCIYHVANAYDAAFVPYPRPQMLWDRLAGLEYDRKRDQLKRTICTDFDYGWLVERLACQLPERFAEGMGWLRSVAASMAAEWRTDRASLFARSSTHDLYCYGIGWAVYQRLSPGLFTGPGLLDTYNAPWLFRLPGREWVAG